jgi:hypothetical protein
MHCRNNNDNHNNNYCERGYDIMCTAFQHGMVLLCEYTNRLLINKELLSFELLASSREQGS